MVLLFRFVCVGVRHMGYVMIHLWLYSVVVYVRSPVTPFLGTNMEPYHGLYYARAFARCFTHDCVSVTPAGLYCRLRFPMVRMNSCKLTGIFLS